MVVNLYFSVVWIAFFNSADDPSSHITELETQIVGLVIMRGASFVIRSVVMPAALRGKRAKENGQSQQVETALRPYTAQPTHSCVYS